MSLFNYVTLREAPFVPSLNTGTLFDIATGSFIPGAEGCTILNGGMNLTNATVGRPQKFKSTNQLGFAINALARYPGCDMVVYDTERTLVLERIIRMATTPIPEMNTCKITTRAEYYAEDFFAFVLALAQEKQKRIKDYMVEVPIIDPKTGKSQRMIRPTFVGFDSWSNMEAQVVEDTLRPDVKIEDGEVVAKSSITSSDTNTWAMKDGMAKKKLIKELNSIAEKAGMYMFFTAHVGDKIEMNPYAPTPKSLQHMKGADKPKGVGADFLFLMQNLVDCREASLLQTKDKEIMYPSKGGLSSDIDLNEVTQVIARCKGNASGSQITTVVSQTYGIDPGLTDYHYLRAANKRFGLPGNDQRHAPALMPDMVVQRTTISEKLRENPKLARALEILAQLCYIQNNWTMRELPVPFDINPQDLADKLLKSSYAMDDILASRGWWTYEFEGHKDPRPYLSLFDILGIVQGTYKPSFLPTK